MATEASAQQADPAGDAEAPAKDPQALFNDVIDNIGKVPQDQYARKVFGCIDREFPPRKLCIMIVKNVWFDRIIMLLIAISSLYMVADDPIGIKKIMELDEQLDQDWGCGPGKTWPEVSEYKSRQNGFEKIWEMFFLVAFGIEMAIKIISMGLIVERGSYLRSTWNWLDAIVVISGFVNYFTSAGGGVSVLRLFRLLRPLRALQRVRGMRVLVNCILAAMPQMCRVFMVLVFVLLVFGIVGTQLMTEGALRHQCFTPVYVDGVITGWEDTGYICDPHCDWDVQSQQVKPDAAGNVTCRSLGATTMRLGNIPTNGYGTWTCQEPAQQCLCGGSAADDPYCTNEDNPNYGINSFDNIGFAMVTIFQSISLEGWVDIMYMIQDGTDVNVGWIYQMLIVLVGALIVMNLFLAVLADNFAMADNSEEGGDEEEEEEGEKTVEEAASKLVHTNPLRKICLALATSKKFELAITACIFINTITMCIDTFPNDPAICNSDGTELASGMDQAAAYPQGEETYFPLHGETHLCTEDYGFKSPAAYWVLFCINAVLTLVFTAETVIKLLGLGPRIFAKDSFNLFDFLVVAISLVELGLDIYGRATGNSVNFPGISALRALRVFRVFKMVRSFSSIRSIMTTLALSLSSVVYLGALLLLFVFIFALLGMEFFGGRIPEQRIPGWATGVYNSENFPCVWEQQDISWDDDEEPPRNNFDSFPISFVSIFIVLSGENWNEIYFAMHRATWKSTASYPLIATFYFIVLFVVGNLLLFNLFIAILISNMEGGDDEEEEDADAKPAAPVRQLTYRFGGYSHADDGTTFDYKTVGSSKTLNADGEEEVDTRPKAKVLLDAVDSSGSTDRSCCIFSWKNPIRRMCAQTILHPQFDQVVVVLICISSVMLGLDWPGYNSDHPLKEVISILDIVFTILFTVEMCLKIVVLGFVYSRDKERPAYLRDPWNILDCLVVVFSIISLFSKIYPALAEVKALRAVRALRALRPLRLIVRLENMRIVVSTLIGAVPNVSTFGVVMLLFVVIFAILFVQLYGGRLGYCLDPGYEGGDPFAEEIYDIYGSRVIPGFNETIGQSDYEECMKLRDPTLMWRGGPYNLTRHNSLGVDLTDERFADPSDDYYFGPSGYNDFTLYPQWVQPDFGNFDNIPTAVLLLFEVALLEGWPDVMFWVMDADFVRNYIVPWPYSNATDINGLFGEKHETTYAVGAFTFVIWIVLGCFVLLNMVIGVVLDSFNSIKEENDGLTMMTEEQGEWVRAQKEIIAKRPLKEPTPPSASWRQPVFNVVNSNLFDLLIMIIILVNMVFMCLQIWHPNEYDDSVGYTLYRVSYMSNIVFFTLYSCEMVLKWVGLGVSQYFKDPSNAFDCFLVCFSAADLALSVSTTPIPFPPTLLRVVRLFRVVRILRILRTAKHLRTIITTIRISLPGLYNISVLLFLVLYIYAVLCMNFFWAVNYTPGSIYPFGFNSTTEPTIQPFDLVGNDFYYTNGNSNDGDFINRHANFRNLGFSILTLFRCATGESFNGIMHDMMDSSWGTNALRCCPSCAPVVDDFADSSCGSTTISIIIMMSFTMVMGFIILNGLFIGVIVDNFTNIGSEGKAITIESIEEYREVWLRYDPKGSFVIPSHSLLAILQQLRKPLGIADASPPLTRAEMLTLLGDLNIPDHGGFIHFMETLTALAHRECGTEVPICDTTKRIQRSVARTPGLKNLKEPVHNALTNYLVSLLQSRWRGYAMRKRYQDTALDGSGAPTGPPARMDAAQGSELSETDATQGKVAKNQVMPAPP